MKFMQTFLQAMPALDSIYAVAGISNLQEIPSYKSGHDMFSVI